MSSLAGDTPSGCSCLEKPDPKQIADPQHSTAKRQQRSNAFTSHMANASLERQLLAAQASKTELEAKLREKDTTIERLERDRRWFAEREEKEREEKLQEQSEREEEQVRHASMHAVRAHNYSVAQGRFRTSTTTQFPRCRSREPCGTRGQTFKPFSQPLTISCFSQVAVFGSCSPKRRVGERSWRP